MPKHQIFISSVQKEFKEERRVLKEYILGDALLSRFFTVFIFEDIPAADRCADSVYLVEVKQSKIYLGLFGNQYGIEDRKGSSPTHKEFNLATQMGKPRLIFVKGDHDAERHSKMRSLLRLAGEQLIRRRFNTAVELCSAVYASLVHYLLSSGLIITGPFDATVCRNAELKDVSEDKVRWFLARAKNARDYALDETTPVVDTLTHLDLLEQNKPNHAAILLFGIKPQRFLVTSEIKCMHFHGTQKLKPIPSYQIYKGTVFDLVDQAVDFVMSKLNRYVGTREHGPQAPVEYDIPQQVVAEGIVNAVAHRDYTSSASVEVMLFSDRLEIWNPGTLPPSLTIKSLRKPHPSHPGNPLIAEPFFLTKYIEKAGTGTVDIYEQCKEAGLRPPQFRIENGFFILTIWRKQSEPANQPPTQSGLSRQQVEISKQPEFSTSPVPVQHQSLEDRILVFLNQGELPISLISKNLSQRRVSGQLKVVLKKMLDTLLVEYTIPDKPNSRLQKYKITAKGRKRVKGK